MTDKSLVLSQIYQCEEQQYAVSNAVLRIREEITQLQRAQSQIVDLSDQIRHYQTIVNKLPEQFKQWRGQHAAITFSSCYGGELSSSYSEVLSKIKSALNAISNKIQLLQQQLANQEAELLNLDSMLTSLSHELDQHQKD